MYIIVNDKTYTSVTAWIQPDEVVYSGASLVNVDTVSGTVSLYANNGFLMREDNASDYERQIIEDGSITLTNKPEPQPEPEPEPVPDIWDAIANAIRNGVNAVD